MMIMKKVHRICQRGFTGGLIGLALLIGGCSLTADNQFDEDSPFYTPVDFSGYQDRFPIGVRNVTNALELPGKNGQERLSPSEIRQIGDTATAFLKQMQNQLVVSIPGGAAGDARVLGRAKQIGDLVKRRGVPASRIMLRVAGEDTSSDGPIVISYSRLVITVSECGIWDKVSSHDVTNTSNPNFGCATQRNIGLMIDNPRDLIEPRQTTATHDAVRSSVVLEAYRSGAVSGAERADIERATGISAE